MFGFRIIQGRFGKKGKKVIVVRLRTFVSWTAQNYKFIIKILLNFLVSVYFQNVKIYLKKSLILNFKLFDFLILWHPSKLLEGKFSTL